MIDFCDILDQPGLVKDLRNEKQIQIVTTACMNWELLDCESDALTNGKVTVFIQRYMYCVLADFPPKASKSNTFMKSSSFILVRKKLYMYSGTST